MSNAPAALSSASATIRNAMFDLPFDPTKAASTWINLPNASVGKAAGGFPKIHVELPIPDLVKMIGYDPRSIQTAPRKGKDPANIDPLVITLHRDVQRSINNDRVAEMVAYLHHAVVNNEYGDWAEIDLVTTAKPDLAQYAEKFVVRMPSNAEYLITDGQHRFCAVMDFARQYPELAQHFTQAVAISVLPQDRLEDWAGQAFHDKNFLRAAVRAAKALSVDHRDLHNKLTHELHEHPLLKKGGGVNSIKDSVGAGAKEFCTHSMLYKFVRGFCEGRRGLEKGELKNACLTLETYEKSKIELWAYLDQLRGLMPNLVAANREDFLFRTSNAIQALGVMGFQLHEAEPDANKRVLMLSKIGEKVLSWKRDNKVWAGVIGEIPSGENSVAPLAKRSYMDNTIKFLCKQVGLT